MTDLLRSALLSLHKTLIDQAKQSYESTHGPIVGPAALFRLVVEEPSFQWFRPLSETIVAIDEALENNPPATHEAIVAMVKLRLFPDTATDFSRSLEIAASKSNIIKMDYNATRELMT
ncbi:hypothetical protein IPH19_00345 [Candidatus Uhrbacteria bacterium]|jgi:hypothetical protein|nr:MAG: hypothetical protein IPH19_00345 [Candidatus Uhrbacteria bacterium]